ncbi:MAG: zinc ribbon domain-containing protein [Oscillospiraceae bacterium]|nr:zinc ribbon domain-containing protein [Oscillospiraceae bacterium]
MEGYKTFTEALEYAHRYTLAWVDTASGDYMSYDDMVDLSLTEDMLFGLEEDDYFLALDDGAICLCSFILKKITVLFRPTAVQQQRPVGGKFCTKCGSPLRTDSKFCLKCGAKVVTS